MSTDSGDDQQRSISAALRHAKLTIDELWMQYFALGGEAAIIDVDAYVHGLTELPPLQRDILAHAVNERLDQLTPPQRATYSRPYRESRPRSQPLAALVELLERTELAPPERLPAVTAAAGQVLGVEITIYVVDYDERLLHPLPVGGASSPHSLPVDGTVAGRAYRHVRIHPVESAPSPRLWVPMLDGVERLGVLEVVVPSEDDLYDPGLRTQCRWIAGLVGHLVALLTQYGDAMDLVRLPQQRTVAGELIWSMLPPLTAGVDDFVVTGLVEPRQAVCGDAFDYSLSERTASLIVLDAVGHDPRSGLIAATALAACRSARHAGHGLFEQARTIEEAIGAGFEQGDFVTAVLAEIDLATGRMRYLNAGHPFPLIMRDGKVVKPLTGGRRLPLGLGRGAVTIAEEVLQPSDWLVLYTDGVTEARSANGESFGEARLTDFLHREASTGHPPPETARRLVRAVLDHQNGVLQDDATILLARWTNTNRQMRQVADGRGPSSVG